MEDKLRDESRETFSDQILDIGEKAAAAGIAAAAFYRGGGRKLLAKGLNKYSKKAGDIYKTISRYDYDHVNYKTIQDAYKESRQIIKEEGNYSNRYIDDKINLMPRRGTALGDFTELQKIREAQDNSARDDFFHERVQKVIRENYAKYTKLLSKNDQINFENFLQQAFKKLNSIESSDNFNVDELIKAHDKTGRMAGVMRQALDNAVTLQNSAKEAWKEVKDNGIPVKNKNIHAAVIDKTIERILEVYGKPNKIKSFINAFTNDTGITFKDLIDEKNADKFAKYFLPSNNEENKRSFVELQEAIRKQAEELLKKDKALHDRFLSIEIDPFLRKSDDKFYDFNVLAGMKRRIINTAARTVPGKILRFPDWEMHELVPAIKQFAAGSVMPSISALERKAKESLAKTDVEKLAIREAHDNIHIENNYWYILGNLYRHEDDKLIQIKEFDNASLISSRYAGRGNLLKSIYGFNPERTRGFWTNLFDINGSVEANFYEKISNFLKGAKDLDYEPTIISNIRQGFVEPDILKRYDRLIKLNEFVERNVRGFDNSMLENMEEAITQLYNKDKDKYHAAYEIFKILKNGDLSYEGVDSILTKKVFENVISKSAGSKSEGQVFHNLRLNDLINSIFRDPLKAAENITLEDDITGAYYSGAKDGASITRMLQKELSKELILQISHVEATRIDGSSASAYSFDLAKEFLEKSKMNLDDMDKAKELSYATISEHNTGGIFSELGKRTRVPSASKAQDYESLKKQIEAYEDFLAGKTANKGALEASETIFNLIKRSNPPEFLHTSTRMRPDDISALHVDNDFYIVANSEGPFSMLKALNDSIKEGSVSHIKESIMRFAHQLAGGRGDADNVTNLTLVPYFFLHRLGADDLPAFMQFSNQSTSSTWQLIKTLGKRLAPVAIGATYLEWADDTVGAITGTRASAGIINALDYTDIGVRNLLDNIGIGGILEEQSRVNPILQYWFGRDGYYDAEEERNYYANGVEAVRSGRYWAFGSVNEFRGGAIQYYRPNLTRRLNSDYYNKALYDGYFNKWSHSLLPTPIMPFSPLVYALDPYYLENQHYNDRPYMLTAPMFAEGTPWGAVLNPTIGELIKPVKRMHEDRMYGGSDALTIISSINRHIRDTAEGNHAYAMVFDRDNITAGEYTGYSNPSFGQYSIRVGQNKHDASIAKQEAVLGNTLETNKRNLLYEYGSGENGDGFGIGVAGEGGSGGYGSPLDLLGQTNRHIKAVAAQTNRGGIITPDRIHYHKIDSLLSQSEDIQDLLQSGQGHELLTQMASSMRLIAGIYGYGAHRFFGFGDSDEIQIANAGDIDSFSRSFWDFGMGGIGGGAAEIGRRFIPEFRRNIRRNPLLNTMPDWLPEEFRTGDPYAQIPYGEARLPGKGYEALNKLHPDEFGDMYGAFDRFKILADVAPNSTEFKVWKQIAKKTIKDPTLMKEMSEIQNRVYEANKQHDFYDYQILGQSVDYQDAIIKEVYKDGTFRIIGSDEVFKLAGIDTKANLESRTTDRFQTTEEQVAALDAMREYLVPGHSVVMALDSNIYHRKNDDAYGTVAAAVFANGENVSQALLENHSDVFARKENGITPLDTYAMAGPFHRFVAGASELLSHLDLPLIHDRWLRVRSPLESYNAEQVYGTPYQTWSEILGTFLFPALERSVSDPVDTVKSTAEFAIMMGLKNSRGSSYLTRMITSGGMSLLDRGAFIGGAIGYFFGADRGKWFEHGQKIGAAFQLLGTLYTSTQSNSILTPILPWAEAGFIVGDILDPTKAEEEFLKSESKITKFFRTKDSFKWRGKFAAAGAIAGVALHGMIGPSAFSDAEKWVPERVQKKWEVEDYFDRLTYIKYMGLYQEAASKAKSEEGIDIEKVFEDHEKYKELRQEIIENSDVNNTSLWQNIRRTAIRNLNRIKKDIGIMPEEQSHRFEFANGFSINDLPGVRNGVFHSEEISEEERLYTLNALVSMGIKYGMPYSSRTNADRDMTQLTDFEKVYNTKIPDYYQVHHIIQFSKNGPDDPSNMIALNPDDHLYITEAHERFWSGDFSVEQIGAKTAVRLGEYGRSALLYKKVAESTMYGLKADASWADIVKALPKYERDYFTEFMKEKDPDKQQEILQQVSPFLRRALKQVWGMDYEEDKGPDNEEYFQHHNLPNFYWEGWDPDSDLNNIKAKVIKNEGMMFSDFGIYESTYRNQEVINAPNLKMSGSQDPITLQANLAATMSGLGLKNVEVSVEPKATQGIQSIVNLTKVIDFKLKETINEMFS